MIRRRRELEDTCLSAYGGVNYCKEGEGTSNGRVLLRFLAVCGSWGEGEGDFVWLFLMDPVTESGKKHGCPPEADLVVCPVGIWFYAFSFPWLLAG